MTADLLRAKTFADLGSIGFRPARWLPPPDMGKLIRPEHEVAARLMALNATVAWVAFPEQSATTAGIQRYIDRNGLLDWLTETEVEIINLPREEAQMLHIDSVGWRLENMWALAWVMGFEPEPNLEPRLVCDDVTSHLVSTFVPGLDRRPDRPQVTYLIRPAAEVIAMNYRFYCAHNAVRSAQLGSDTVPAGFDPIIHGGAVQERRHALSWCIAPNVAWDDIELST